MYVVLTAKNFKKKFTEGNARKFSASFAFCDHVDVIKIEKKKKNTDVFRLSARRLLERSSSERVQWQNYREPP